MNTAQVDNQCCNQSVKFARITGLKRVKIKLKEDSHEKVWND